MPRPGPRPYECVRRAWHSDRHQPMRGSLIKEIFRVVNEIHSSVIKKNKEWREKIPIVVLKAEEILYSKANSEAEYMDLTTLRDRANDAINTIIRLDDSTESGKLLLPCIEAALHLGCTPRWASRSQRNNTPSGYLSASIQKTTSVPTTDFEKTAQGNCTNNAQIISEYSRFMKPTIMNSNNIGSVCLSPIVQSNIVPVEKFPSLPEKFLPRSDILCLPKKINPSLNTCSVYPLHCEDQLQSKQSELGSCNPSKPNSCSIGPSETKVAQMVSSHNADASNRITQVNFGSDPPGIACDLSLRLGPSVVQCKRLPLEVGLSTSREGSKYNDLSPPINEDFSFFFRANSDDPLNSCLSERKSENAKFECGGKSKKKEGSP
ncbi:unnamed protein product [Ilex paraguariensis]|uniref:Histone acetyltransferase n=1 Tax=Ilex paraguariensis TaxID=185542 RepID=A0ABC8TRZ9_9AQUA